MDETSQIASGPLVGVRVVELAGRGPTPFGAMLLADMGAEVIRVERPGVGHDADPVGRGRTALGLDLKADGAVDALLDVIATADVFIEGFRPGVTERMGLGPDVALGRNPRLVYARMTGWGQDGPAAALAGHDINYIAAAGALYPIGREGEAPVPPLNLLGDYGGGGMFLAFGVACALVEVRSSGLGQVIDAAMFDGVALLTAGLHGARATGAWNGVRGTNFLDSGAPWYGVYETADGHHVSVGAIEGEFYGNLVTALGLPREVTRDRMDRSRWPMMRDAYAEVFRTRTREEWADVFEGVDACFAPVLSPGEAVEHEHAVARGTFVDVDGVVQPAPAPRFSRTPAAAPTPVAARSASDLLADWGVAGGAIHRLCGSGA